VGACPAGPRLQNKEFWDVNACPERLCRPE
jgi:hypothetical protein